MHSRFTAQQVSGAVVKGENHASGLHFSLFNYISINFSLFN
jgi:hypothetical protein